MGGPGDELNKAEGSGGDAEKEGGGDIKKVVVDGGGGDAGTGIVNNAGDGAEVKEGSKRPDSDFS